jgi:amino acid adenylation domain-containing protein
MMVGILGILKSGAAYVPIDSEYPQSRIDYMLEDIKATLVLTDSASGSKLNQKHIELVDITKALPNDKQSNNLPSNNLTSNNLAYIIYTSGSTGTPKGVMVEHGNVVSLAVGGDFVRLNEDSVLLSTGSSSFDATTIEYWGMLLNGGKLVLCTEEDLLNFEILKHEIQRHKVTIMWFTAGWFNKLVETDVSLFEPLHTLMVGGEKLSEWHINSLLKTYPTKKILNGYGPTENTTFSLTYDITEQQTKTIPIGRPLANRSAYILDENQNPLPIGVPGELYVGGDGVSRGYLNQPELTQEKFIQDPFTKQGRLYKTGDLGRWLPDGNIEYLGRIDDQVKIRGYRIELGEIEAMIQQSGLTSQSVVIASEDTQGTKRLVGYVVATKNYSKQELETYLGSKLPEYMVPRLWVELDQLPLTANGKIDKRTLPEPNIQGDNKQYVAAQNQTQQTLVEIWQELLGIKQIGIEDNFFELGGHSLLIMSLRSLIRNSLNVDLEIREIFSNTTIQALGVLIAQKVKADNLPSITHVSQRPDHLPLSYSQERLWFIDRYEGSVKYNLPSVLRLQGELNLAGLEFAIKSLVNRHDSLRTIFYEDKGSVYQQILPENQAAITIRDLQGITKEQDWKKFVQEIINYPFDLSKDHMIKVDLLRLTPNEHVLVVVMHHIAADAWSVPILIREFVELYNSFNRKRTPNLPSLSLQYSDYALWQRAHLTPEILSDKLEYWKNKLKDIVPLELSTDYPRPKVRGIAGDSLVSVIDTELTQKINDFSLSNGVTLYMTLLSAYNVLLSRYSSQQDISVGASVANRPQQELESLIGFFVNTITLRSLVNPQMSFKELLDQVKQTTLEAYEHQDVPFEKIVEAVVHDRDQSRSSLFQVMLVLLNTPERSKLSLDNLEVLTEGAAMQISKFDLTFHVRETPTGLRISAEYSTELFKRSTIEGMLASFRRILEQILQKQDLPISAIDLLEDKQKSQLLLQGKSEVSYNPKQTVLDMLQAQTAQHPTKNALVDGGKSLTYEQLQTRSNQIANLLLEKGVKPGSPVVLYVEQGLDRIAGIVGILKSGAAYVPIDTEFPPSRIEYILSDTKAKYILSTGSLVKTLDTTAELIDLDKEINQPTLDPTLNIPSNSPAYIIYTSGSTGQPKGVTISHGNLTDYVYGLDKRIQISGCTSYALLSSIATDLGNTVIYSSLVFGGTLHVFTKEQVRSAEYLQNYFNHNSIDCLKIVPSHWKALSEQNPLLPKELLIFGGESLPPQTLTMIYQTQSSCRVVNHYGPTETTIGKLLHEADKTKTYGASVPIGTPFGNTQVYVLSPWKTLTPVGVPGELYIGGEGVSQGYWNNEPLTQEKFISNPIEQTPQRLYATGDRVKYLEDGTIEYLGRVDDQVKIRGYRVEPMEIERIMDKSGLVQMAAIEVKQDSNANKYLVGYLVPGTSYSKDKLTQYLKQNLPEYMIPGRMLEMESFPMLPNGKIDRRSLPDPQLEQSEQFIAPSTEQQKKMAAIWEDILEVEGIGINDDFFALGGHSLLAIRLVSAIRKAFEVEMPIGDIFDYPTIAQLLPNLELQTGIILPPITKTKRPQHIPLSFSQERLWFIDKLEGSRHYHIPSVLKLKGNVNTRSP